MISFKTNSRKDLWIHLGIILCVLAIWFLGFFFLYLPWSTHHGESITVPNLVGMKTEDLEKFLTEKDLRFEVSDSNFVIGKTPLTVLNQYPAAGANVKQNRKIYLTISAQNPPMVKMPKLIDLSLRSAENILQSFDLQRGSIEYKEDLAENTVLEQKYKGNAIKAGSDIPKGAQIDLIVSDGKGNKEFSVPNLIGKSLEEASFTLKGSGLQLGAVIYEVRPDKPLGKIFKQNPAAVENNKVRAGDLVDVHISGKQADDSPKDEGGGSSEPNPDNQ